MIHHHEDGVDFVVLQLSGRLKVVLRGFEVVFGALPAGGFDFAKTAMITGLKIALAVQRQFCDRGKHLVRPAQ